MLFAENRQSASLIRDRRSPSIFICVLVWIGLVEFARAEDSAPSSPALRLEGWTLVWHDEFNTDTLDSTSWSRCKRGNPDWMNTMSNDPSLLELRGGYARLRAIENPDREQDPAPYLTAGIETRHKRTFRHGKIQIRARFRSAQGAWPALWMLGAEKRWPASGEIDLMEHLNFDKKVYQTVHSAYTVRDRQTHPKSGSTAPIERDDWNTYGCEWDTERIQFTVNGEPTHMYPRLPEKGERQWPFDQPFFILMSMQVGGGWVNQTGPTNPDHYPAWMDVDWVRVWEKEK